jgi:putative ABC transport system permease protein
VSGLLISRTAARRRELAVRAALGAGRAQLIRPLVAESLVLGVGGGLLGLLLGLWSVSLLRRVLPDDLPRLDAIALDGTVAAVTLAVAVVMSVLFGAAPALHAARTKAAGVLREAARGSSGGRTRSRAALVVGQVALTLVLVVSAGLLVNSLLRLQRVDSGYRAERVTVAALAIPQTRYPTNASQAAFYTRLLERLGTRAEFEASGTGFPAPLRGENASGSYSIEGRPPRAGGDRPFAYLASISGGYFDAVGIDVIAGRTFTIADTTAAPGVVVVSATLARRDWPGEDPIGKHLRFGDDATDPWLTVVGVTSDVRHIGLDHEPPPVMYMPYAQFTLPFTTIAIRSRAPDAAAQAALRAVVTDLDPELPLGDITTLGAAFDESMTEPRFRMVVFSAMGVVALVLAAVGLFGVVSASVTQQTREIGIRIALGASPGRVLRRVVGRGVLLAGAGVAIGLVAAAFVTRAIAGFLYGIEANDPLTFAAMAAMLIAVALLASYVPARRVLRLDPVVALRTE